MPKTLRHVLKADEVAFEGPLQLSIDPAVRRAGARPVPTGPSVRIIQSHPDHAVVEVACSCGRTTHIRCEYPAAGVAPVPQEAIGS